MRLVVVMALATLAVTALPGAARAADAYTEAVALLNAMNARARYDEALAQLEKQVGIGPAFEPEKQRRLLGLVFDEMARIYSEVYTAEELIAIREFFESPAGRAYLAKTPQLTEKYLEVAARIMSEELE